MRRLFSRVPPLTTLVALVVIACPTAVGLFRLPAYSIEHPIDMFSLGTELLALIFPLLAALVATARISTEVANRFIVPVRTRASLPNYIRDRLIGVAAIAFVTFFSGIFIWFVVCFYLEPAFNLSGDWGVAFPTTAAAFEAASTAETMSQLIAFHPIAYGIVYSVWVGLWAALWAVCTGLLLLILPNRISAYAVPTIFYWLENTVLSNVNLPSIRSTYSAFPGGMTQQSPILLAVPFAVILAGTGGLWWFLRVKKFQTAPLA